ESSREDPPARSDLEHEIVGLRTEGDDDGVGGALVHQEVLTPAPRSVQPNHGVAHLIHVPAAPSPAGRRFPRSGAGFLEASRWLWYKNRAAGAGGGSWRADEPKYPDADERQFRIRSQEGRSADP